MAAIRVTATDLALKITFARGGILLTTVPRLSLVIPPTSIRIHCRPCKVTWTLQVHRLILSFDDLFRYQGSRRLNRPTVCPLGRCVETLPSVKTRSPKTSSP